MKISRRRQEEIMHRLIEKGYEAARRGDCPFSAALVDHKGDIVLEATNTEFTHRSVATVELSILQQMSQEYDMRSLANFALFTNAAPYAGGMIYALRSGIRHFYYGAPTESDAYFQPLVDEIINHLPDKVYLHSGILQEECQDQIQRGRYVQREVLLNA